MHLDFGDLVSSMDGNNFSYDEDTNYVTVNREIIIRFDKVDVKYYPGSFIMPEQLAYTVEYPTRIISADEPEQKQDQLNTPKDETIAELEKQRKALKKKKQSKQKQDKRQSGVSLIDIEAERKQKRKDDQEATTLNKCFAISPLQPGTIPLMRVTCAWISAAGCFSSLASIVFVLQIKMA
jgi:hypothetical protein